MYLKNIWNRKNKLILIDFLNTVIKAVNSIQKVEIKNNYIDKEFIEDESSRLNIKATTNNKDHINIEIQVKMNTIWHKELYNY